MNIPFEVAQECCPTINILGLFKRFGAHLNFNNRTISIPESKIDELKKTWFMGSVIAKHEEVLIAANS